MKKSYTKKVKNTKENNKVNPNVKPIGFFQLFQFSKWQERVLIFIGTICSILQGSALPATIYIVGDLVDSFSSYYQCLLATNNNCTEGNVDIFNNNFTNASKHNEVEYIDIEGVFIEYTLLYTYIGCGASVLAFIRVFTWAVTSEHQVHRIRIKYFRSVISQELEWFEKKSIGEFNNEITTDIHNIQDAIGDKCALFFECISTFLVGFGIAFARGWQLTLVMICCAPLLAVGAYSSTKIITSSIQKENRAYAKAGSVAQTAFSNLKVVSAFGGQQYEIDRYNNHLKEVEKQGFRKGLILGIFRGYTRGVLFIMYTIAIVFGWKLIVQIDPSFTSGKLLSVFFLIVIATSRLSQGTHYFGTLSLAKVSGGTVFQTIHRTPIIDSTSESGYIPENIKGEIVFHDVDFAYSLRKEKPVLNNLKVNFNKGKITALVGPSGMGKSTIICLMLRIYDPTHGKITLDGVDLKEYNVRWLRDNISVVQQAPELFNTTITDNICYGVKNATKEMVEEAAKAANAYEFISELPEKFETVVGEKSSQLSGGQKQRIALARALIRKPKILLLDQTCSALDVESEAVVLDEIKRDKNSRTTVIIAHRLKAVQIADIVVGIEHGKVVEKGSHKELMENEGVYHSLMTLNSKQNEDHHNHCEINKKDQVQSNLGRNITETSNEIAINVDDDHEMKESLDVNDSFSEDENDEEINTENGVMRVLKLNKTEWPYILGGSISALLQGAVMPVFAFAISSILQYLSNPDPEIIYRGVIIICPLLAGLFFVSLISATFQKTFFAKSGEILTRRLRRTMFQSLINQNISWFDEKQNATSMFLSRLSSDTSRVKMASGFKIGVMCEVASSLVVALTVAFVYSWKLTLVILAIFPFIIFSHFIRSKMVLRRGNRNKNNEEMALNIALDALVNKRTITYLGNENIFINRYADAIKTPTREMLCIVLLESLIYAIASIFSFLPSAITFRFGGYLVSVGEIEFHTIFIVFLVLVITASAFGGTMVSLPDIAKGKRSAARVFKILDNIPNATETMNKGQIWDMKGNITFKDCHFSYPCRPDTVALDGLNLSVSSGETVALIGQSGCGKSTTVQMVERFYRPSKGNVFIDGQNILNANLSFLRSNIGMVFQDPVLFEGTIKSNIAYGENCEQYSIEDIHYAAKLANIHDFITSLEKGYDTIVGHCGNTLSLGEKQRISIARALIRNPKILLLDEATSALDTENEGIVQEALDRARKGRTCIIIAHRLSTIRNADVIAVMSQGKIVESGSHDQLMAKGKIYYNLIKTVDTLS